MQMMFYLYHNEVITVFIFDTVSALIH